MINIKKSVYLILASALVLFITSCNSTQVIEKEEKQEIEVPAVPEVSEVSKKTEVPQVPEDPADVKFVKALHKCLENNDRKGALALFEKLPDVLRNDIELRFLEASLYYSDSQFDKAIEVCNEILAINPQHIDTVQLLSNCYKQKGDSVNASKLNDKILKADPFNPSVNIQKAEEQVLRKKWKLARTYYSRALQGDSNNIDALYGYAKMSYYLDDLDKAEQSLGAILDQDPTNVAALAYLGTISFDRENYLRANQFVEVALEIDPYNYDNLLDHGTYLRFLGKYDEALVEWKKAIELDPDYFLPYVYIASIYDQQKNDYEKALEYYYKTIEKNPNYYYTYESIGILEYHLGNFEQAANSFQIAYTYRDSYDYTLMTAACYYQLNKPLEAKKVLAAQMKKLDRNSTEYALVRFYHDSYNSNAENSLKRKVMAETNSNIRGKMTFYLGLYHELNGSDKIAAEYYAQVASLQAPMFFEYRLAEWGLQK